jgi:hypothetical protein
VRAPWLLLVVASCGRHGFATVAGSDAETEDSSSIARVHSTLRLDRLIPSNDLVDFPLLVTLDDTRADRSVMATDASDVRFFDADGTPLSHEIERVGAPGGPPLVAWVRIPRISGIVTLTVAYGYNNPPTLPTTPVWPDTYLGVWHLAGGAVIDSSPHHRDGVDTGTTVVQGIAGLARSFVPGPDKILVADGTFLATTFTMSGWMRLRTMRLFETVITRELGNTAADDFYLGRYGGQVFTTLATTGTSIDFTGSATGLDTWFHVALSYDGAFGRLYLDGVLDRMVSASGSPITTPGPLYMGCGRNNSATPPNTCDDDFLDGALDEIRLESVARSTPWLAHDVASARDQLITYGVIERL